MTSFESQQTIQRKDFKNHPKETSFEYKGYMCKIIRCRGHWCGYVIITAKSTFNDLSHTFNDLSQFGYYDVHGGVTYVNPINENKTMIGFDCGHVYDFANHPDDPSPPTYYHGEIFRTYDYVKSEITNMVDQLIEENIYKP